MAVAGESVKVYTVNGATTSTSSSLPDWIIRRKETARRKGKKAAREHVESTLQLIQGFEFPEASNRITTTRDGQTIIATGTYKPQIRVWDLQQLSLKFERHTDAENVDFVTLSDDWTKSIHLQNDRTVELHTQGGFHYRTRIPRFGRSIAYHFPSCDALIAGAGNEVYRLNLEQGRFMNPLVLKGESGDDDVPGVNIIDINPAHQLLAFGTEGNGAVQFWDPRSRTSVGTLQVPWGQLQLDSPQDLSVTALASRTDGLTYAVGTSSGHTLLYDIRSAQPFGLKDQGYGLPLKKLVWLYGRSHQAGDGLLLSADKKVIKIWDRNTPSVNFASITPATDVNDVHHIPGSGLIFTANEGIQMAAYYIPQLGPAPRWASFLENITEEMEDQTVRNVYQDFKFVSRDELRKLGLDHLLGTPAIKPYMHGYFIQLKLYETARLIANPFAYAEHREKMVKEKMEKLAETRIRTRKDPGVKVNKALAEKVLREDARAKAREERKKRKVSVTQEQADDAMDVEDEPSEERATVLSDPRFAAVFQDPEFAIDENSREYALLNPSSVAQKREALMKRPQTVVEDDDEDSDSSSPDDFDHPGTSDEGSSMGEGDSDDSSDAGDLNHDLSRISHRGKPPQPNRAPRVNLVPLDATSGRGSLSKRSTTFGQRRAGPSRTASDAVEPEAQELTWMPSTTDDQPKQQKKNRKVETFGLGLEKGRPQEEPADVPGRSGRTHRRKGMRSGSKNVFRKLK